MEVGPCLLLLGLGSSLVVIAVSLRLVVLPDFTGMSYNGRSFLKDSLNRLTLY